MEYLADTNVLIRRIDRRLEPHIEKKTSIFGQAAWASSPTVPRASFHRLALRAGAGRSRGSDRGGRTTPTKAALVRWPSFLHR